jgi:hypothetical protein
MGQYWIFEVNGDNWKKLGWLKADSVDEARRKAKNKSSVSKHGDYMVINQRNMNAVHKKPSTP